MVLSEFDNILSKAIYACNNSSAIDADTTLIYLKLRRLCKVNYWKHLLPQDKKLGYSFKINVNSNQRQIEGHFLCNISKDSRAH